MVVMDVLMPGISEVARGAAVKKQSVVDPRRTRLATSVPTIYHGYLAGDGGADGVVEASLRPGLY